MHGPHLLVTTGHGGRFSVWQAYRCLASGKRHMDSHPTQVPNRLELYPWYTFGCTAPTGIKGRSVMIYDI